MKEFIIIYGIGVLISSIIVLITVEKVSNFKDSKDPEERYLYEKYKSVNDINHHVWIYLSIFSWFTILLLIYMYISKKS